MTIFRFVGMKRYFSAIVRGGLFFVLLVAVYTLVGINFDRTRALSQIFGSGTPGRIAIWVTSAPPPPPPPGAPQVSLVASPATVASGGTATLTWTVTGAADSCTATGDWSGAKSATGGSEQRTGITSAKTYTLQCSNAGAASSLVNASVAVSVPGTPVINSLTLLCTSNAHPHGNWSPGVPGAIRYEAATCRGSSCSPSGALDLGMLTSYLFDADLITPTQAFGVKIRAVDPSGPGNWSATSYIDVDCPYGDVYTPPSGVAKYGTPFLLRWDAINASSWAGDVQYGPGVLPPRNANSLFDAGPLGSRTPLGYYVGEKNITVSAGVNPAATAGDTTMFALTITPSNATQSKIARWSKSISLLPGDFSLSPPTNSCVASLAPVGLVWNESNGAQKYNVFRVVDANSDGAIQQGEVDAAGPDVDLNLRSPLLPKDVCSGATCRWTDESAQKNTRYLYFVRSRNTKGDATFSNSPVVNTLADLKPKSLLTQCAPTASLTPAVQTIDVGQTATLTWGSTNADRCTVNQGVGIVCDNSSLSLPQCDTGGTTNVSPQQDTSYTLTCRGAGGPDATSVARVNLNNQAPRAVAGVSIGATSPRTYATSIRVKQGVPVTLHFAPYTGKFPATTAISSDPDTDPAKGILNGGTCEWNTDLSVDPTVPGRFDTQIDKTTSIGDGFPFDSVNAAKDCIVSATHNFTDAGGKYLLYRLGDKLGAKSNVANVTITAVAVPQITSFTATPSLIGQGDSFTLAWASAGTASCSSTDFTIPPSSDTTRGSVVVSGLATSPKTYTLACASTDTDLYPTPATQTVTVNIKPANGDIKIRKAGQAASANTDGPLLIQRGEKIILAKSSSDARTCAITDDQADFDNITDTAVSGEVSPAQSPPRSMIFTMTCRGDGGADTTPDTVVVNVDNVLPTATAGASLDTSSTRTYANTITVTQGVPAKIYLSAGGSTDVDGGIRSCQWNSTFNQDPPIASRFDRTINIASAVSPVAGECDTVISSLAFPLPTEDQSVLGVHTYRVLTVTDDKSGVSAPATLEVNILPRLVVSLNSDQASGDAPFTPSLRANITSYTGPASDTGNFYFWFDCANTSDDFGTVKAACGNPTSIADAGGDRTCTISADKKMAKCETVPLQGFDFLSLTAPGYDARVQAYTPKVLVERGGARPAESRTSVTANTPFAYTLTRTGGDLDVVKGASSQTTTIDFKRTGGSAQQVSFSVAGLPAGTTASFSPSSCTSDCTTTLSVSATNIAVAGGPATLTVSGSSAGGTSASVALMIRDVLTCGPSSQTATVGVPISQLTAAGGTGTYLWEALNPTAPPTLDPNASPNTGTGANFTTTFNTSAARTVRVSSGIQTAACNVNLTGQTLGVAISAVPDRGTEPVRSVITGQITSASTAVGTINYTFWWHCPNTSATVTDAINGTQGGPACGDPRGATDLATNYPQITCKANTAGAKCDGINPAAIPGFDPVNKPLQVIHPYGAAGSPYTPKVIIERGAAPAAEARYTGQVIASFPALTVACAVPATATAGQQVSWSATPAGGSGQYAYSWAGSDDLQGKAGTPVSVSYFTAGTKTGIVTVRDTTTNQTAVSSQCSTLVSLPPGGAPVAIAGVSRDTATTRVYRSSIDVKKGESITLFFAAERTTTSGVVEKSSDPDGWTDQFNGIATCQINRDLSTEPVTANQFTGASDFSAPVPVVSPDVCRASQPQTFNNAPEDDTQISRTIGYNTLRLVDKQNLEGVGQASITIHYAPEIASFTVNGGPNASVNSGAPVEIKWNAKHASSCTGTGFDTGNAPNGTKTVNPTSDTTYSVSCSGSSLWGAATARAAVTINGPTADIKANGSDGPITVAAGTPVTLTWTSSNASSCTSAQFNTGNAANNTSGVSVNPTTATTYSITCTGTSGRIANDAVVINLNNAPPMAVAGVSANVSASRTYAPTVDVKFGTPTGLFFSAFLGPKSSPTSQSSDPDGWTDAQNGVSAGGNCAFNLDLSRDAPTSYERIISSPTLPVSCEASQASNYTFSDGADNDGQIFKSLTYNITRITDKPGSPSNEAQSTINIHYSPEISTFTVNGGPNASVNSGAPVEIKWNAKHASSCTGTGFDTGNAPNGTKTVNPTADTTYSLSCSGSSLWGAATASAAVTINGPTADIKANGSDGPITVAAGTPVTLTWTSSNASSCTSAQFSTGSAANNTSGVVVNPTTATTYTLVCQGTQNRTATDQIVANITNGAPVAVAGVSKDTNATRSYASSVDVKSGVSTPLFFSAFLGPKSSPTSQSSDPDGWTDAQNGVSAGGRCSWNLDLSPIPNYANAIVSPASPTICEIAAGNKTFSDLPENDNQIFRPRTYNILQIADNKSSVSNDAPVTVNVHYQPTAVLTPDKSRVGPGAPVVLTWSSQHATSCTGTGFDTGNAPNGTKTVNPTADTTYSLSCSGSSLWGAATARAEVKMSFNFTLSASRSSIAAVQGSAAGNTITVTRTGGTAEAVILSAAGLPAGTTATFSPASCNPGTASCASTLTLSTTRGTDATPVGVYPITVTGTAGTASAAAAPFNLQVSSQMTVSLAALPSAVGPSPYVLQLQADAPAVEYTGDPGDTVTYTFWKNCDQPGTDISFLVTASVCGTPDYIASNTRDLSVRTTDLIYTQAGSYRAKVVAVRNAAVAENRITITVDPPFNYTMTLDRSRIEMIQETTVSSANRAVITHISGNASRVPFSARINNLPASVVPPSITFNPTACTPPAAGTCGSDISLTVPRETPAGEYNVTVSAGSQSATFTLAVTSRISAALSALPSDRGAAPLGVRLKADASNYTGSPNDALNYTFWWDCNNTTDNPSDAAAACGNPNDTAVGFKMNSTLQLSVSTPATHIYPTEGVYFAKVIIERGGARREVRIPITVGNPKVAVTCSVAPSSAVINQPVIWTATPSNGVAPYGFGWTKDVSCGLNPDKCETVSMRYASSGDKFGSVTVTDSVGDTASRLCDNSLKVFQPTLVITPAAVQIRTDGESVQLAAKYDPDGPDGSLPETDVTNSASWSIPLNDQNKATISGTGLVTSRSVTGNAAVSASFRDNFNNVIVATATIGVIARDALICDPSQQTVRVGEQTFPMTAMGGTGSYDWTVQEIDASPRTGSTAGSQTFTTKFGSVGAKTVKVTSGSQSGSCRVNVTDQNLAVNLSVFPASVTVPQSTRLTAVVSGNALGTMNYSWWWNCGADKDADNTTRVEIAEGRCGELPHGVPAGQCQENQFGAACAGITADSKALDHAYMDAGNATPKVIVERGSAAPAQSKASVAVDAANRAPVAVAGLSINQNANRVFAKSIVVTQNVPTLIFFGAFTGSTAAPDEVSSDPDGWSNKLNGMHHPQDQTATGQCAWNADLDRNAQVSFEDVSGPNRNPASAADCVTSFVHNFSDLGSHTYAVLRMTDNRGGVSAPALVTVDVVAPGAPVAVAGISGDPSSNRVYRDTVRVKQGEDTQLWVSAQRGTGPTAIVSSDPDGWSKKNGGVSKGGSCRWNRDLDRGVFPTGIPTYEWVINDPLDPMEDCDTRLVNEQNTSFTRVFMDVPGIYSYEALRIFDNTGLRSNKAMVVIEVLPSSAPVAVASASTDGGRTFSSTVAVVRGEATPISFSAVGSTDPDGWTNPVNGVSVSGQCAWNDTLSQGPSTTFSNMITAPSSPSACNLPARTFTFNDRPGVIDFQILKIADNKSVQSGPATISVRVMAPDLVISSGPTPTSAAALTENGSVAFVGTIRNQGDAATTAAFQGTFTVDIGNDGSTDLTLGPSPVLTGLATGGEKNVTSGPWNNLPPGTHKVTLCADRPGPSVANEFFTENNCSSQIITVLPDNRAPVAEAGISLDGVVYGASITVLRGRPVQIWLSADKDVTGDRQASFDPDGWTDPARGIASGGRCEWNLDLSAAFAVQNTVNNPASPSICNRNRMDKTFNDPAGTYVYPVLRLTDAKLKESAVAAVSVRVVDSLEDLNHVACVSNACTIVSGAGTNVCSAPGGACTGGAPGGPPGGDLPDLTISDPPRLASGELRKGQTATFSGRVKNEGAGAVTRAFGNVFLVDLKNDGTVNLSLRAAPRTVWASLRAKFAALPTSDITLPLSATISELAIGASAPVASGEWRNMPEGTHRVIVCADSDNMVNESDETDNCASTVMTVESDAPPAGPLRIDSCRASASSARAGELVDWTAQVSGGTGGYSFSWSGDAPLEGNVANPVSIVYRTMGTKSGSLIVTSGDETASRACGTVNVTPGILEFNANPRRINPGQSSTLSWSTTGFSSCRITADQPGQNIGSVDASGSSVVRPDRDTRYTLSCVGASQSQSITIVVSSVPRVEEIVPQ